MKRVIAALACILLVPSAFGAVSGDAGPFGETVFVRGGFNDWGTSDAMTWDAGSQSFSAVLSIDAGPWQFKIANEGWDNPDFGPTGDPVVTLGEVTDIGTAIGLNFQLTLAEAGDYRFTLFNLADDLQSGSLRVTQVVPVPAALLLFGSALAGLGFARRKR